MIQRIYKDLCITKLQSWILASPPSCSEDRTKSSAKVIDYFQKFGFETLRLELLSTNVWLIWKDTWANGRTTWFLESSKGREIFNLHGEIAIFWSYFSFPQLSYLKYGSFIVSSMYNSLWPYSFPSRSFLWQSRSPFRFALSRSFFLLSTQHAIICS